MRTSKGKLKQDKEEEEKEKTRTQPGTERKPIVKGINRQDKAEGKENKKENEKRKGENNGQGRELERVMEKATCTKLLIQFIVLILLKCELCIVYPVLGT